MTHPPSESSNSPCHSSMHRSNRWQIAPLLLVSSIVFIFGIVGIASFGTSTQNAFATGSALLDVTGQITMTDVDTTRPSFASDRLSFQLDGLPQPDSDREMKAYLLDSALQASMCTAPLTVADGALSTDFDFPGKNLIATYDTIRLMQESDIYSASLPPASLGLFTASFGRRGWHAE